MKIRLEFMFLSLSSPIKHAMDQMAASFPIVTVSQTPEGHFWPLTTASVLSFLPSLELSPTLLVPFI